MELSKPNLDSPSSLSVEAARHLALNPSPQLACYPPREERCGAKREVCCHPTSRQTMGRSGDGVDHNGGDQSGRLDDKGGSGLPSPTKGLHPNLRRSRCSSSNHTTSSVDSHTTSSTKDRSGASRPSRNTKANR